MSDDENACLGTQAASVYKPLSGSILDVLRDTKREGRIASLRNAEVNGRAVTKCGIAEASWFKIRVLLQFVYFYRV